ncbi:MAG: DsrE family protein [Sporichthyaceae bacterium]
MSILISITHGADNADMATVGFVVASAAAASAQETTIFLSSNGATLARAGEAGAIHEEGFAPLQELLDGYLEAGGALLVCSPCAKKRGIGESDLVPGAQIVGGGKVVEIMAAGAATLTY